MPITRLSTAFLCALTLGAPAYAQSAIDNPECVAPANPGGGFDLTCRMAQTGLQPHVSEPVQVTFMPGARSAWHTHPIGQYLVVTAGTGWYQEEGQPKQIMRTGDVVFAPEGVNHWHGATDTTSVTHYAIQANEDGSAVTWGELVSDEEYNGE